MMRIGLTGSIAMGKSEVAKMFRRLGYPVFDADETVHRLYAPGGAAVEPVSRAFPGVEVDGGIDRARLTEALAGKPEAFARLEAIVHPLVRSEEEAFLAAARASGQRLVVLDIPLLFETGRDSEVDRTVVVSAPGDVQRERALRRSGMSEEKLAGILARQVSDGEKRRRADFVIDTSGGLEETFEEVRAVVDRLIGELARKEDRHA